jgi:D-alanyl-lipoteichoic acid acyltransferase DltB (MBOAT superfamily)
MKHLDPDWEVDKFTINFIAHFWDTIEKLGGWKGLAILLVIIGAFYGYVMYAVKSGRKKRESKKHN